MDQVARTASHIQTPSKRVPNKLRDSLFDLLRGVQVGIVRHRHVHIGPRPIRTLQIKRCLLKARPLRLLKQIVLTERVEQLVAHHITNTGVALSVVHGAGGIDGVYCNGNLFCEGVELPLNAVL